MEEIWKNIPGWEGIYQVSNLGRVKSLPNSRARSHFKTGAILKPWLTKGYQVVGLRRKKHYVHQLVCLAFIGPRSDLSVNHKNGIKHDNRLGNLEYVTHQENMSHAFDTGLSLSGEACPYAKLTEVDVIKIRQGITGKRGNIIHLARTYGVSESTIRDIRDFRSWGRISDTVQPEVDPAASFLDSIDYDAELALMQAELDND